MTTVKLPKAFKDFMQHVNHLIAIRDDATTIESDDLLQCDCVYGGLYDRAGRRFRFRYFHGADATWDFDLDVRQIVQIANGEITHLNLWHCSNGNCSCYYAAEDAYCPHCDSVRHFDDYESRLRAELPNESGDVIAGMAKLRKIGLAINDYHAEHGHLPPPYTSTSNGTLLHSWRSLILPFLDHDDVHERIDFDRPWNADVNRAVLTQHPDVYHSPDCPAFHTRFMAIVDHDTIWPPIGHRRVSDITSGTSYTVAVIQSRRTTVNWMQPADIDIATAVSEYNVRRALLAVFVDAHVDSIEDVDMQRLRELVCI